MTALTGMQVASSHEYDERHKITTLPAFTTFFTFLGTTPAKPLLEQRGKTEVSASVSGLRQRDTAANMTLFENLKLDVNSGSSHNQQLDLTCTEVFSLRDVNIDVPCHVVATEPRIELFKCVVCKGSFASRNLLSRHLRLHVAKRTCICDVCGHVFGRRDRLKEHRRTHTGERPYKCLECPYAASRRDILKRHMRTHTNVKSFKCSFCEKEFYRSDHRNIHEQTHKTNKRKKIKLIPNGPQCTCAECAEQRKVNMRSDLESDQQQQYSKREGSPPKKITEINDESSRMLNEIQRLFPVSNHKLSHKVCKLSREKQCDLRTNRSDCFADTRLPNNWFTPFKKSKKPYSE